MVARGVDVGDQAVDELVVIGEHFGRVAVENRQLAEILGQGDRLLELDSDVRTGDVGMLRETLEDRAAQGLELDVTLLAPLRQRRPPDQRVQDQADRRLEENEQQPALSRIGRAAHRYDDDHREAHRPFHGEEQVQPQLVFEE